MCVQCLTPILLAAAHGSSGEQPEVFPTQRPAPGWLRADPVGATITWAGCAGFLLEFDGARICFDPFVSNPGFLRVLFGSARSDAALVRRMFGTVAAAFIGHTHYDHAMDVAVLAHADPGMVVYGSDTTAELCRRQGLPAEQIGVVRDAQRITVGPFRIEAIASEHGVVPIAGRIDPIELTGSGVPRSPLRWPRGDVYAYRVEVADISIHIQTSAGIADAPLARQAHADILIACLAARHGTPGYVERLGDALHPSVLIPCHHDNFLYPVRSRPRPVPQLRWPEFLRDVERLRAAHGTRLVQLPRGTAVAL